MNKLSEERKFSVSIIIPVYNEEETVLSVIQDVDKVMRGNSWEYEIIVVNDGSNDKSKELLKNCGLSIRLIEHEHNRGYGAALKAGIRYSKNNIILMIDADGTYPINDIPRLLDEIKNYDMVVGSRTGKHVRIPLIRKPAKWFINKLANYLTGTNIPDLNSGLRVTKKAVIEKFIRILPDRFSFTTTITLAMLADAYQVKFIPINYYKRQGKSKIKPIQGTFNFVQLIIRTVMYFNPLKIFLLFSLLFFIPGFIFFVRDILSLNIGQTTILLLVTGSIILSMGMLADLINKKI